MGIFSVVVLQFVADAGSHTPHAQELEHYFGTLPRTVFTMFESIVGGINWDHVVSPLISDISPAFGLIFSLYIAASMFAVMNMLTGVFVDRAIQSVREDKDMVLASRVRDLFFDEDEDAVEVETEVSWQEFKDSLETATMQCYLQQINVNTAEAEGL